MRILKRRERPAKATCLVVRGVVRAGAIGVGIYDETGRLLGWGSTDSAAQASYEQHLSAS